MLRVVSHILKQWRIIVVLLALAALWSFLARNYQARPRLTITTVENLIPVAFSPDGKWLVGYRSTNGIEICKLSTQTGDVINRHRLGQHNTRVRELLVDFRSGQVGIVLVRDYSPANESGPWSDFELIDLTSGESLLPEKGGQEGFTFRQIQDVDWDHQWRRWPKGNYWLVAGQTDVGEPRALLIDLQKRETQVLAIDFGGRFYLADGKWLICLTHTCPQRLAAFNVEASNESMDLGGAAFLAGTRHSASEMAGYYRFSSLAGQLQRQRWLAIAAAGLVVQTHSLLPGPLLTAQAIHELRLRIAVVHARPNHEFSWFADRNVLMVTGLQRQATAMEAAAVVTQRWDLSSGQQVGTTTKPGPWHWCSRQIPFFFEQQNKDACLCYDALADVTTTVPVRETESSGYLSPYAFGQREVIFFDRHIVSEGNPIMRWLADRFGWQRDARTTTRWVEAYGRGSAGLICSIPRSSVLLMDPTGRQVLTEDEQQRLELWDFPAPGAPHMTYLLTAASGALVLAFVLFNLRRRDYLGAERYPVTRAGTDSR